MAFPIILGVSEPVHSEQELEDLKAENDKGVTYEGKHYTLYEASQQQRKLERSIRKVKRELIVSEQFGDKDDFTAQSIRLRRLREYYNDFSNKCRLTKREDLLSVGGYGRKISGKAVTAIKNNKLDFNNYINKSIINNKDLHREGKNIEMPPMDDKQFKKIVRGLNAHGVEVWCDLESEKYLDARGLEASNFGTRFIILRPNPTASAVFEEIIHYSQNKHNEVDVSSKISVARAEIYAKEKLIRNKKAYGITAEEQRITQIHLEKYKEGLSRLLKE